MAPTPPVQVSQYPGCIPGTSQDSGTYTPCPSIPGFPSILGVSQEHPRTVAPTPPVQVSQYPGCIPGTSQDSGTYTPCPSIPGFPSILGVSQEYPRTVAPTPPVQVSQDSLVSWVYPRNIPGQNHVATTPLIP